MQQKYIVWFSCGAASTVALFLSIREFGKENIKAIYQDTGSEHPDNKRYIKDVEEWLGINIIISKSSKFNNVDEVFEKYKLHKMQNGAKCTQVMKREVGESFITYERGKQEIEIFGYTIEEEKRVKRWTENNKERKIDPILIRHRLNKNDCLALINEAGITIPFLYTLGYKNNNCIGCVKAGIGYWNKIKKDFPDVFTKRSEQERRFGYTILMAKTSRKDKDGNWYWPSPYKKMTNYNPLVNKFPMYLDEIKPWMGKNENQEIIECGPICMTALKT